MGYSRNNPHSPNGWQAGNPSGRGVKRVWKSRWEGGQEGLEIQVGGGSRGSGNPGGRGSRGSGNPGGKGGGGTGQKILLQGSFLIDV